MPPNSGTTVTYRAIKLYVRSSSALFCLEKLSAGVATADGHDRFLRRLSSVRANCTVSDKKTRHKREKDVVRNRHRARNHGSSRGAPTHALFTWDPREGTSSWMVDSFCVVAPKL